MKCRLFLAGLILSLCSNVIAQDSISLYIFLLDDCIICQSYTPKVNDLYKQYGEDVAFIGVFPNFSSKPKKIESFKENFHIKFETRTDYWKSLTKKFEVSVTPEVVIYDELNEVILYKGRIDNEFAGLGKRRRLVTTNELSNTLADIKDGKRTVFPFTEAVGCFINQNDPLK